MTSIMCNTRPSIEHMAEIHFFRDLPGSGVPQAQDLDEFGADAHDHLLHFFAQEPANPACLEFDWRESKAHRRKRDDTGDGQEEDDGNDEGDDGGDGGSDGGATT